jgi:hypothetical protein
MFITVTLQAMFNTKCIGMPMIHLCGKLHTSQHKKLKMKEKLHSNAVILRCTKILP